MESMAYRYIPNAILYAYAACQVFIFVRIISAHGFVTESALHIGFMGGLLEFSVLLVEQGMFMDAVHGFKSLLQTSRGTK